DVLEQEVAGVGVPALAVHGGAPAGELRDVLVVLAGPLGELGAGELAAHPLLGEGVQAAVPRVDGVLELGAKRAHLGHGGLLSPARPGPAQSSNRKMVSRTRRTCWAMSRSARRASDRASASIIERCSLTSPWTRRGARMAMVHTGRICSRICSSISMRRAL